MSEQNSPEAKAVKAPDGLEKLMAVRSASSTNKAVEPNRKLWLDAWHDAVAGLGNTPCVHACNLQGDGEWRLIIADVDKKLKVGGLGQWAP